MKHEYTIAQGVTAFSTQREEQLPFEVLQPHQTHTDHVAVIKSAGITRDDLMETDAIVTNLTGFAIGVRTADCVPVLLYDPVHKAVAAIHSGWRGTVLQISAKAIRTMATEFGTIASDLLAVIGPSIGPDSFQVGPEVAEEFRNAGFPMEMILTDRGERIPGTMEGGLHIDLWKSNKWILEQSGVLPENISIDGTCTYHHHDLYFSARREGRKCGRIINVIRID